MSVLNKIPLHKSWQNLLNVEFEQPYMCELEEFLQQRYKNDAVVYPQKNEIFSALNLTPVEQVKVVIVGQDPYHGPQQAHGLSFSVPHGIAIPPSLRNIFKEIASDFSVSCPSTGNLQQWAEQGVLLLNAVLTVEQGQAAAHKGRGWEQFTDRVISLVNDHCEHVVFMLWGAYAQKKGTMINQDKHKVLKAVHPSPLSAYRGFLGCKHFSQANDYLEFNNKTAIEWQLDESSEFQLLP